MAQALVVFVAERRKKAKAVFLRYDQKQTLVNYLRLLEIITLLYALSSAQHPVAGLFYVTWMLRTVISRAGDQYCLLDDEGGRTARNCPTGRFFPVPSATVPWS
jgi:hypothetical protein